MRSIREFPGRELKWTQPKLLNKYFELLSGEDLVGSLRWEKSFGSLAAAEASERQWTFKRGGFLRPHVTVREADSTETIALFEANWGGTGSVQYRGGQPIRWVSSGFWRSRWMWLSDSGAEIAAFSSDHKFMKTEGRLEVSAHGAEVPELPLLALLGWYLLILAAEDTAAVMVMTSS